MWTVIMKEIKPILTIQLILLCVFLYLCVIVLFLWMWSILCGVDKGQRKLSAPLRNVRAKETGCHMARINVQKYWLMFNEEIWDMKWKNIYYFQTIGANRHLLPFIIFEKFCINCPDLIQFNTINLKFILPNSMSCAQTDW